MNEPEKRFYLRVDGADADDLGDRADYLANHVFASLAKNGLYDDLHGVVPVRDPEYDPRLPGPGDVVVDRQALETAVELADARLDDDARAVRKGTDPTEIGYDDASGIDVANRRVNELMKAVRDQGGE